MLWVKAFHIIFMVCWFAGLFYLPRLFVNHAMVDDAATRAQLSQMEHKLYRFVTPFMVLTVGLGVWLTSYNWEYFISSAWYLVKVGLVGLLIAYHFACGRHVKRLAQEQSSHSHVYFRWFNEFPVLILFGVVILVIVRPF